MSDYTNHLFPYVQSDRLTTLSCGHVIPDENLIAWPVARGPTNVEFDFTYEKRNLPSTIDELGRCITHLCQVIPDGLVLFFPSYAYLDHVIARWKLKINDKSMVWDQLQVYKTLFRETKEGTGAEDVLKEYSNVIDSGKGALLLSVIGGKMSEGINFSDKLGRGVVVVGLPFPNVQSAEWRAKLEYVEKSTVSHGKSVADGKSASRDFYENACMRAVNQSIGRAIRHQKDYASIIMLDRRYDTQRIKGKLTGWIQKGLVKDVSQKRFAEVTKSLSQFFQLKRDPEH